ncbi:MAG TPA: DUF6502 family protein [Albitalea sp.]
MTPAAPPIESSAGDSGEQALLRAFRAVLAPLASLAVARGVHHRHLDELLRGAFVDAARQAHADVPATRAVSRVSAATGLNRREVTRLMNAQAPEVPRRSLATELFTRWLSDPSLRRDEEPLRVLPRHGPRPSFEALAQSVTKDVHPRTLLEEMVRLGLVRHDEETDTVTLLRDSFVPAGDEPRMFGFLGNNVGDHLAAAVANVLGPQPRHLEQAMFADQLSIESITRLDPVVREQWQSVLRHLAPAVQAMLDEDEAHDRARNQRLRIGMYAFACPMPVVPPAPPSANEADTPAAPPQE